MKYFKLCAIGLILCITGNLLVGCNPTSNDHINEPSITETTAPQQVLVKNKKYKDINILNSIISIDEDGYYYFKCKTTTTIFLEAYNLDCSSIFSNLSDSSDYLGQFVLKRTDLHKEINEYRYKYKVALKNNIIFPKYLPKGQYKVFEAYSGYLPFQEKGKADFELKYIPLIKETGIIKENKSYSGVLYPFQTAHYSFELKQDSILSYEGNYNGIQLIREDKKTQNAIEEHIERFCDPSKDTFYYQLLYFDFPVPYLHTLDGQVLKKGKYTLKLNSLSCGFKNRVDYNFKIGFTPCNSDNREKEPNNYLWQSQKLELNKTYICGPDQKDVDCFYFNLKESKNLSIIVNFDEKINLYDTAFSLSHNGKDFKKTNNEECNAYTKKIQLTAKNAKKGLYNIYLAFISKDVKYTFPNFKKGYTIRVQSD